MTRDLFPGRFWTSQNLIWFPRSTSFKGRASLVSRKQNSERVLLDFILKIMRRLGAKSCAIGALTCICYRIIILKGNKAAPLRMPCTVYLYGSEVSHTWSYKNIVLPLFLSESVTGFCFDSFYFITYLCLNEKKTTLFQLPKKFALHFTILFFIINIYIYVLIQSLIHTERYHYC